MAFNIVAGVNNAVYGSVSGSGSYVEGAEVTLEVTVNDGYRFVGWDDGNTDNPRVFNATEDVTLVATLEAIPEYAISVTTNDNSLGTVSGSGTFREGTSTQISATPYVHSRFVDWEDGNSDNPRIITVSAAATYKAIFEAVNYFTISTDVNDDNLGSVTGAGEYDEGDTVTLTAVPETDCRFVSWNDGNTDNPRTFISSADVTYTATFEEIQYTDVTIASNDVSWGTVSGATSGNIETGTTITLTATPATDYKFDGWQVDGEIVSASSTASFLVDGQEMDIIAVFSAIVFYQVTLITNDVDCGSISVVSATAEPRGEAHNIWPDGAIINLQAVTTEGGKFLNWSTGQVDTEITVNVHGNETIRANFYPVTGLILVTKKILQQTWSTIKSFFSAPTGASKIGAPANNVLGATTLADVVNSVGQPGGIAMLNNSGKVAAADIDGTLANDTTGNAAMASVADKVGTTTVGSSTEPVYINAGTPTACGTSLAVDITGNAATATSATSAASATSAEQAITFGDYPTSSLKVYAHHNNEINFGGTSYTNNNLYFGYRDVDGRTAPDTYIFGNTTTKADIKFKSAEATGSYSTSLTTSTYLAGNKGTALINSTAAKGYTMLARMKSTNGVFTHGVYNADYQFYYTADSVISANTNSVTKTCLTINENGTVKAPNGFIGDVTGNCSGSSGSCTGNAANVTGTVAIANGGTGATSRLNALKALTNESVGTNATYFLTITNSWGKGGYTSVADAKKVLGIDGSIPIYYVQGPSTDTTAGTWTGSITGLTAYYNGLTVLYVPAVAGASATTLNINSLGAKTCYYTNTSALTTHYSVGTPILLTYRDNAWRRADYNSNTTYSAMSVSEGTTGTATTSRTVRADYLKQIIAGLPSASCTGNAATATTASACSGNAASSTYATNVRITPSDGTTAYPVTMLNGSTASTNYALRTAVNNTTVANSGLKCIPGADVAADTEGTTTLVIGNALAKATADNRTGNIRIHGNNTGYTTIKPGYNSTSNITVTLPAIAGRVVVSSDSTPVVDIKVVSSLPASPVANTVYLVK